jgi:hypothetical protein
MRCCGIECDPESGTGYSKLPDRISPEWRVLIRAIHRDPQKYEVRYGYSGWPTEQRSVAPPKRSESRFYRSDDSDRERLRLRLEVMRRVSG